MKADRILVAVNALVAAGLGFGLAARGEPLPASAGGFQEMATLRIAGIGLAGLGIAFGILADPGTARDRRRLAALLAGAGFTLAVAAARLQATAWQGSQGWLWVAIFAGLATGFTWLAVEPHRNRLAGVLFGANAIALFVFGTSAYILNFGLLPETGRGSAADFSANVGLLGVGFGAFGLALLGLQSLESWRSQARLALGLAAANAACAAIAAAQQIAIWSMPLTRSLVFLFIAMALAALWTGLRLYQDPQDAGAPRGSTLAPWLVGSHLAVAGATGLGWLYLPSSTGIGLVLGVAAAAGLAMAFLLHRQAAWAEAALVSLAEGEPAPRRPRGLTGPLAGLASAIQTLTPNVQAAGDVRTGWMRRLGEAAAQEERNRLARDLHDSIKQQLFSINVGAAAAQARWDGDPEGARAALADVRRCAEAAMAEMKALLLQLRPEALAGAGLVEALREQCEALRYRIGAEVSCEIGELIPDAKLPAGAQEAIFRVAQEALSNVARHARADKVRVSLRREDDWAVLAVEDDGQGFDRKETSSGMGLSNMHERAAAVSGVLEVDSVPGRGTRVVTRLPLLERQRQASPSLARAIARENRLVVAPLLLGLPVLLDLWTVVSLPQWFLWPVIVLQGGWIWTYAYRLNANDLRGVDRTSCEGLSLRYVALRARAALMLGIAWWAVWGWQRDFNNRSTLLLLLVIAFGFSITLVEAARISTWRRLRNVALSVLVAAAGLVVLPLSMVGLSPALGILLMVAAFVEGLFFIREPRMAEVQP